MEHIGMTLADQAGLLAQGVEPGRKPNDGATIATLTDHVAAPFGKMAQADGTILSHVIASPKANPHQKPYDHRDFLGYFIGLIERFRHATGLHGQRHMGYFTPRQAHGDGHIGRNGKHLDLGTGGTSRMATGYRHGAVACMEQGMVPRDVLQQFAAS